MKLFSKTFPSDPYVSKRGIFPIFHKSFYLSVCYVAEKDIFPIFRENFNVTPLPISKGQLICCFSGNSKSFLMYSFYFLKEKSQLFVRKNIYLSDRDVTKIEFFRFLSIKIRSNLLVTPMHKKPYELHITAFHTVFFDFIILYLSTLMRCMDITHLVTQKQSPILLSSSITQ